ncbi:MAG: antibiotic biosynthesis monooxygenase [Actinomycetota bacterium]|nr:antibiotic biosynthesis monooxygenase [Actinomycetota bacterium]
MLVSILCASVPQDREQDLRSAFEANLLNGAPHIVRAFLLRDQDEDETSRIVIVWRSQESIDEYRRSVGAPPDVRTFLSVGATPSPSLSKVIAEWDADSGAALGSG